MPRSITVRRTALLSALTIFAIPEMQAEPSRYAYQWQQTERNAVQQPTELGIGNTRAMQLEPTQRWVF